MTDLVDESTESTIADVSLPLFRMVPEARDFVGLDSNLLKQHKMARVNPVAHLINMSRNQCRVPSAWKTSRVTPVLKAGQKTKVEN